MSTALIALAATAAAVALTWFFCMRPMHRQAASGPEACCAPPAQSIDDQLRAAREELAQLQGRHPGSGPDTIPPHR